MSDKEVYTESDLSPALVLSVDDSKIVDTGLVRSGDQLCRLRILSGPFEGEEAEGNNSLNGSLEQDKLFAAGDKALVRINHENGEIISVSMIDYYRVPQELIPAALFCLLLVLFAGSTGVRALLSFAVSVLMIWKVLVPCCLRGINPIWVGLGVVMALTVIIVTLVYGFDRRSLSSVAGCALGIGVTCVMGIIFTDAFRIHGAVMSYSESLLYSGLFQPEPHADIHGQHLPRRLRRGHGPGRGHHLRRERGRGKEARHIPPRGHALRHDRGPRRAGHSDHDAAARLLRRLHRAADGIHGPGTPVYTIFNLKYVAAEILHTMVGLSAFVRWRRSRPSRAACCLPDGR